MIAVLAHPIAPPMAPGSHRLADRHHTYRVTVPTDRRPTRHRATGRTEHTHRAARLIEIAQPRPRPHLTVARLRRLLLGPNWA